MRAIINRTPPSSHPSHPSHIASSLVTHKAASRCSTTLGAWEGGHGSEAICKCGYIPPDAVDLSSVLWPQCLSCHGSTRGVRVICGVFVYHWRKRDALRVREIHIFSRKQRFLPNYHCTSCLYSSISIYTPSLANNLPIPSNTIGTHPLSQTSFRTDTRVANAPATTYR